MFSCRIPEFVNRRFRSIAEQSGIRVQHAATEAFTKWAATSRERQSDPASDLGTILRDLLPNPTSDELRRLEIYLDFQRIATPETIELANSILVQAIDRATFGREPRRIKDLRESNDRRGTEPADSEEF